MSALLTSLPGDIPGLRDEGTPITVDGTDGFILDPDAMLDDGSPAVLWATAEGAGSVFCDPLSGVQIRLNRTGRAHAAWFLSPRIHAVGSPLTSVQRVEADRLVSLAAYGHPMSDGEIDHLAHFILCIAGRVS